MKIQQFSESIPSTYSGTIRHNQLHFGFCNPYGRFMEVTWLVGTQAAQKYQQTTVTREETNDEHGSNHIIQGGAPYLANMGLW